MFLIRADGNEKIGIGHMMRCLTIGAELALRGDVLFLCADEGSAGPVRQRGFQALVLGTDYRDMEMELPVWERILKERIPESSRRTVILVDSYCVTDRYLEGLRRFGTVVLMDDMGRRKYPVDVVVNYNVTADLDDYGERYESTGTKLLLGSAYTPLREQFLNRDYQVRKKAETALITVGGGDPENITGRILRELSDEGLEYHVAAGRFNPHYQALAQMAENHENIHLHCNVTDMAGLMMMADIAVTAGGSTVYELASLGVPLICFSCAENQEPLTEYIEMHNIAGYAGAFHKNTEAAAERLRLLFRELVSGEELRRQYHCHEKMLVDGRGTKRLALALTEMEGLADRSGRAAGSEWR